jgi:putative transposase
MGPCPLWRGSRCPGKLRYELLNGEVLDALDEAKVLVDAWRKIYNRIRPPSTLGDLTPQQFVDKYKSR